MPFLADLNLSAIILSPSTASRNTIRPTIDNIPALTIKPHSVGHTGPLLVINDGLDNPILHVHYDKVEVGLDLFVEADLFLGNSQLYSQASTSIAQTFPDTAGTILVDGSNTTVAGRIATSTGTAGKVSYVAMSGDGTLSSLGVLTLATVPISKGGTGQTTASAAFNALAPSQTGQSGKFLTTNGTTTSWGTVSTDHNALTNLTTGDPHTQYLFLSPTTSTRNSLKLQSTGALGLRIEAPTSPVAPSPLLDVRHGGIGTVNAFSITESSTDTSTVTIGNSTSGAGNAFIVRAASTFHHNITLQSGEYISNSTDNRIDLFSGNGTNLTRLRFDSGSWGTNGPVILATVGATGTETTSSIRFDSPLVVQNDTNFSFGSSQQHRIRFTTTGNDTLQIGVTPNASNSAALALVHSSHLGSANRSPTTLHADPTLYVYSSDIAQANDYIRFYHNQSNAMIEVGNGGIQFSSPSHISYAVLGNEVFRVGAEYCQVYLATGMERFSVNSPYLGDETFIAGFHPTTGIEQAAFSYMPVGLVNGSWLCVGNYLGNNPLEVIPAASTDLPAVRIDQTLNEAFAFIRYEGVSASNLTKNITTKTTGMTLDGFVRVNVNGSEKWMPFYIEEIVP